MKTILLLFACGLLVCQLHAAGAEKPARRAGAKPGRGLAGPPGGAGLERVLTDEQRQKMRESMKAGGEKLREAQQQMMNARRELQEAVLSGKANEAFIKEKADLIGKLEGEQLRARMTALAKVAETLTSEQRDKLKEMGEQARSERPRPGRGPRGEGTSAPPEPAAPPPPVK
jgi:Spy/CpxP family protein refolding chaperone